MDQTDCLPQQISSPTTNSDGIKHLPYKVQAFLKAKSLIPCGNFEILSKEYSTTISPQPDCEKVRWRIHDWSFIDDVISRGHIGFFEAYQEKKFETDNLPLLLRYLLQNNDALGPYLYAKGIWQFIYKLKHLFRPNNRKIARKNIQAHYDLSNDFFKLWLDPTMTYSSACFGESQDLTLQEAQHKKYQTILDSLNVKKGARILEIGCGWGGFASYATNHGYKVHGITISKAQYDYIQKAQHDGKLHPFAVEMRDYRDVKGTYDAIVSIEMYEALGEAYWGKYFDVIENRLKPGGKALIQGITIDEKYFEDYRKYPDFIQLYVFPGGMLASKERFIDAANRKKLSAAETLSFGFDYAKTLTLWLSNFYAAWQDIQPLGFDQPFKKLWEYYLAYCIAGFLEKRIDVNHFLLEKPA